MSHFWSCAQLIVMWLGTSRRTIIVYAVSIEILESKTRPPTIRLLHVPPHMSAPQRLLLWLNTAIFKLLGQAQAHQRVEQRGQQQPELELELAQRCRLLSGEAASCCR